MPGSLPNEHSICEITVTAFKRPHIVTVKVLHKLYFEINFVLKLPVAIVWDLYEALN